MLLQHGAVLSQCSAVLPQHGAVLSQCHVQCNTARRRAVTVLCAVRMWAQMNCCLERAGGCSETAAVLTAGGCSETGAVLAAGGCLWRSGGYSATGAVLTAGGCSKTGAVLN